MKIKKITAITVGLALLFSLASCGQAPATGSGSPSSSVSVTESTKGTPSAFPGTPDADTVVLDITSEPLEMNSMLAYDTVGMKVLSHCISGITKLDKNDQPVADLAEKWEISPDNRSCTVYLRKDAKWSNGEPVTAKDFYFSWVTQMTPETGTYMAAFLYENIKNGAAFYQKEAKESDLGLEVIDDYTLKIEWERPTTGALFLFSLPSYFPVNQKAYEEIGAEEYGKEANKLITNGAYRLTEWVHDDHILLEKSLDYYNADAILVPKARLVMLADANTRLNAFMTGSIDLCNLYSDQISQIQAKDERAIQSYFDGGSWYLGFNVANKFLANENLRKALSYSIDIQSLLDHVIADGSIMADGLVPPNISGVGGESYASARGSLSSYNVEEAKKCLELALAQLNVSAADLQLTLDVANTSYNKNQAEYIQQEWSKNLGIQVAVNAQAWSAVQEAKFNGDYNISVEVNSAAEDTPISFLSTFTSDGSSNFAQYIDPAYDKLINAAKEEADPQKKQDLMIEAETLLVGQAVVGPLYYTRTTYAVSDKLQGLVRTPFHYFNLCEGASIKTP